MDAEEPPLQIVSVLTGCRKFAKRSASPSQNRTDQPTKKLSLLVATVRAAAGLGPGLQWGRGRSAAEACPPSRVGQTAHRGSNSDWKNLDDPGAKIIMMKDGHTHLGHKVEHAVDIDTGATLAVAWRSKRSLFPTSHTKASFPGHRATAVFPVAPAADDIS